MGFLATPVRGILSFSSYFPDVIVYSDHTPGYSSVPQNSGFIASSGDGIKHTKIARIISRNDPGLTLGTKCYVRVLGTTFIVSPFIYFFLLW